MGRIKTTPIKRKTKEIFAKNKDRCTNDFVQNKKIVEEAATFHSKKLRNVVAGYVTRLNRNKDNF
ncbi:MAG: 30S ribosomal protein S17e [Candidatus Woesearchaeota archaeon]|jgi:small subunit ribosomal protein S17e